MIYELVIDERDAGTKMTTCESAQIAMSAFYQQGESKCYWNQLLHGQACGCPDNSEIRTLGLTQHYSASSWNEIYVAQEDNITTADETLQIQQSLLSSSCSAYRSEKACTFP